MSDPIRIAETPPPLKRWLRYGMSGDDVKIVQGILKKNGFFSGSIGGNFLDQTRAALLNFQWSHIDEMGQPLDVDAVVGEQTWWALHNASGSAQRNFIPPAAAPVERVASSARAKLLDVAMSLYKLGVVEIPDGSNYGPAGSPLRRIINACGFSHGIYWCMALQSVVHKEALGEAPFGAMHVGCKAYYEAGEKWGVSFRKETYEPIPGDVAIWLYVNEAGKLNGSGHAARVAAVSEDGKKFNTLEGNIGNRYKFGVRAMSEPTLFGFVNPVGDHKNRPNFKRGISSAPVIAPTYAQTR